MLQSLDCLRRTDEPARAATAHIGLALVVDFAHSGRSTDRARVRHMPDLAAAILHHAQDLRDDIPCPLDFDRIAGFHAKAFNFVFIVKRCIRNHDAANRNRGQARDRRQRACAADLNVDSIKQGRCLLGRKFVCDGPAWVATNET